MIHEDLESIRADAVALVGRIDDVLAALAPPVPAPVPAQPATSATPVLAWGAKVSQTFRERVVWIVETLQIGDGVADGANKLMTCMAWESGRSFRADVRNMAGSGATGLIQFMPATALGFFHTAAQIKAMSDAQKKAEGLKACERLARLSPEDQLNFVYRYFEPFKGRLKSLSDVYMAILWPAAVGKPEASPLWDQNSRPTTYRQNAGLDVNKDGTITKAEAAAKVAALLPEGLKQGNVA